MATLVLNWCFLKDVLRSRAKTCGVVELCFEYRSVLFYMYDVGGQQSERRKWIHLFSDVNGVIFVSALSEYDQVFVFRSPFSGKWQSKAKPMIMRLDCNIKSKLSNNIYLNIIKIFNKIFKKNKHHGIQNLVVTSTSKKG